MTQSDIANFTYVPVPEFVDRFGLFVTGAGSDVVPPGAQYPRQQHPELYDFSWQAGRILPEYQFVLIAEGSGEFESKESGRLEVSAGSLLTLFPDVWHRYRPNPETGWTEYWLSLGGDFLFQWHNRGLFRPDQPLTVLADPSPAIERYQNILKFAMECPSDSAPMLAAYAMTIVATAINYRESSPQFNREHALESDDVDSSQDVVNEALRIIWNHSHQRISIDMIAKQVGVNRRTLERKIRQKLGRTILEELVACRIQRAKRLLAETHVPIKYVAYAAGFSSLSNLCKVFRREVGITPGDFRDQVTKR